MEHLTHEPGRDTAVVTVRFWAGAAAAAGCTHEEIRLRTAHPATGADLRRAVVEAHPGIDAVLRRCSLLQAGARIDDADVLGTQAQVEVLPPFVGG